MGVRGDRTLNNLIVQISEILEKHGGSVPLDLACKNLGVTRRMLNYNLAKMNDILLNLNKDIVQLKDGNFTIDIDSAVKLKEYFATAKMEDYIFSSSERRGLVFIIISLYPGVLTIDLLSELIGISRSTLTSEITDIKTFYSEQNFTIEYLPTQGYIVTGIESEIRYKVVELMYSFENYVIKNIIDETIQNWGSKITKIEKREFIKTIEGIILESEENTQVNYIMSSRYELVRYLLIVYLRNRKNAVCKVFIDEFQFNELNAAKNIVKKLQLHDINVLDEEIKYITSLLLGTKLAGVNNQTIEPDIIKMATFLLNSFTSNCMMETHINSDLFKIFVIHVRSMIYRIKYNIKIDNAFTENILLEFPFLTQWARLAVNDFEKRFGITIQRDEFIYLCIYFGTFIKKPNNESKLYQKKVLIVCGAGAGTSYFLKNQLQSILGEDYKYEIVDYDQSYKINKDLFNLIVTTVELKNTSENYIKVNTVLTEAQKLEILNWSLSDKNESTKAYDVSKIIDIVEKYADISDRFNLVKNLRREFKTENEKKITLKEILKEHHFQVIEEAIDYKEAIRLGCKPLLDDGIIDSVYCDEILEITEELGLYAEYIPGILLAHAKSDGHVHAVGITCTIFKRPVQFKKWDKEISVIITLATYNTKAHIVALDELFELLKNKKLLNLMLNYKDEKENEIKELFGIKRGEEKYEYLD